MEETVLKQEDDKKAVERRNDIKQELEELQAKKDVLYTKWEDEKAELEESKNAKVKLEKAKLDLEQAQNEARYEDLHLDPRKYSEEEIQAFKEKYEVHDLPVLNELYEKKL